MTENNNENNNNVVKTKKTLTLGSKGKLALEKKVGIEQKKHAGKGKSVLEVVSNSKVNLKSKLSVFPSLGKTPKKTYIEEEEVNNDTSPQVSDNLEDFLTNKEKKNRLEALEKAKKEVAEKPIEKFVGFSLVESKSESSSISHKKDKKTPTFRESPKKEEIEVEEEKIIKKKSPTKKRERNESERAWKDAYYENDLEENLEEDTFLNDELEEKEDIIINLDNSNTSVVHRSLVNNAIKRVGKTKKDKSGSKNKIKKEITINGKESVKSLAHRLGERLKDFVNILEKLEIPIEDGEDTILDLDSAELVVLELGHTAKIENLEENLLSSYKYEDKEENMQTRPPIVTIMGHVDHGKTTLLDYIRKTNVVSKESGGITQHIGAYQITTKDKKKITFLDTPGHEAFAEMRARGAMVTDIIILVVAADDGLKQQSIEVINHANSANVPIVVAINKIDKPGVNSNKIKTELLQHNVVVEEMGGKVLSAEISALKGTGVDNLLENILLEAELLDLKANKNRTAIATVIESKVEKGKGIVATVIVSKGTLKQGDLFVVGDTYSKVRLLIDENGKQLKSAEPGTPVEVLGFNKEVKAGDELLVVNSESDAKKIIEYKQSLEKEASNTSDNINLLLGGSNEVNHLPVIIKADVYGSKEAIVSAINKLGNDEVKIKVVHSGIGAINESDILLAKTSNAMICGFNVRANNQAKILANNEKINIKYFSIIYDLLNYLKEMLSGMLQPKIVENITGLAEVKEVFSISKVGKIAGCIVTEGHIKKSSGVRLLRNNVVIYEGTLAQLKRFKDDVKEVISGQECGIMLQNFQDIVKGDLLESFEKIVEKREL